MRYPPITSNAMDLTWGPKVPLRGNVHGLARPEFELGRADSSRLIQGISLAFRPSPAQQKDLNRFLAELRDPKSPNYHKYLTPAQFGERFGLSLSDIAKVATWLHNQGFTNIRVANGRNQISFDGTVGQVETSFAVEMHNYGIDGVVHLANAGEPSIPAALGELWFSLEVINKSAAPPFAVFERWAPQRLISLSLVTPYASDELGPVPGNEVQKAQMRVRKISGSLQQSCPRFETPRSVGQPLSW